MAKLFETLAAGERHDERGMEALGGEDRSEKQARGFPPRSRFFQQAKDRATRNTYVNAFCFIAVNLRCPLRADFPCQLLSQVEGQRRFLI